MHGLRSSAFFFDGLLKSRRLERAPALALVCKELVPILRGGLLISHNFHVLINYWYAELTAHHTAILIR